MHKTSSPTKTAENKQPSEHCIFTKKITNQYISNMPNNDSESNHIGHTTGIQEGVSNYADNVVFRASRGHGFAAEKANHLKDKLAGKDAQLVGGNNLKNGADRLVDGQKIQTKYCSSGAKCIAETFENGKFRYLDNAGKPMQIEVPRDMHESAVQAMSERIKKGQIPGVTDPARAGDIVRKGHFTYQQVKNIAKAGTVEGLTYDAVNGIKLAGTAMGVTALLTFSINVWRGNSKSDALDAACFSGICVGGLAWVASILAAQIGRTGIENSMRIGTDWCVKQINTEVVDALANAFRSGENIYGAAAANHVSKLLRGQIAITVITTSILSVDDFIALFSREISGTQAFKNVCKTVAGVGGGSLGAWGGGAIGTLVGGPGAGTFVGSALGATAGGFVGGAFSGALLDSVIDDDAVAIGSLMERTFGQLAEEYLLSEDEANSAIQDFRVLNIERTIKSIHASDNRIEYTYKLMQPFFERVAVNRPPTFRPITKKISTATEKILNQLSEFNTNFN